MDLGAEIDAARDRWRQVTVEFDLGDGPETTLRTPGRRDLCFEVSRVRLRVVGLIGQRTDGGKPIFRAVRK